MDGNLLAVLVDQKDDFGIGVDLQSLESVLDLLVLLLVHHEIRRRHVVFSPIEREELG
jgi:hypothetical protein